MNVVNELKKKKRNYKKEINLMNSTTSSCFSNWSTNSFWSGRLIWMLFIFFGFLALWLLSTSNFLFLIAAEIYFVLNRRFWQLKIWICAGNFFLTFFNWKTRHIHCKLLWSNQTLCYLKVKLFLFQTEIQYLKWCLHFPQ